MLEQGKQRHRREPLGGGLGKQPQEGAGRRLVERHAGGIIHRDVPAPKLHRHPPGQAPVRRHQRGRGARHFQLAAHHQGDGERFFGRIGAVDATQAAQGKRPFLAVGRGRQVAPGVGDRRRRQGMGHDLCTAPGRTAQSMVGKVGNRLPRDREACEKPGQAVLRMAWIGLDRLPGGRIARPVETGEHDHPLRQPSDDADQVGRRGDRPGRTGDDHRVLRGRRAPRLRLGLQQAPPALRRADRAF